MKEKVILYTLLGTLFLSGFSSCKKKSSDPPATSVEPSKVLNDLTANVILPNLEDLKNKASHMNDLMIQLAANPNDANLLSAQTAWYDTRNAWEQSEAFLFGPVSTLGLDPSIDDWPVNYIELDSVLNSSAVFTDSYIQNLNTTLKGFHPIEYLIFGVDASRKASELSARKLDYLKALSGNLAKVTLQMYQEWVSTGGNYAAQVINAGQSGSIYTSRKQACLEVVNAMIGIVDEVANGKIAEPFNAQDSMLEESPFSGNSWKDFTENLKGARNVYSCSYTSQGVSLKDWVDDHNRSLNQKVLQKMDAGIANLSGYTERFGQAIYNQPAAIQSTMQQINDLKKMLKEELIPLIQLNIKD